MAAAVAVAVAAAAGVVAVVIVVVVVVVIRNESQWPLDPKLQTLNPEPRKPLNPKPLNPKPFWNLHRALKEPCSLMSRTFSGG